MSENGASSELLEIIHRFLSSRYFLAIPIVISIGLLWLNAYGSDFGDYFDVVRFVSDRNPYVDAPLYGDIANYPPLAYVYFYLFYALSALGGGYDMGNPWACVCCVLFLALPILISLTIIWKVFESPVTRSIASLLMLVSYPVFMSLIRANINIVLVPFILFFLLFRNSSDKFIRNLALLSIVFAGCIKIYPLILMCILIYERKYREFCTAIFCSAVLLVLPFLFFKGGFDNIHLFFGYLTSFQTIDTTNFNPEDISLCAILRGILLIFGYDVGWMKTVFWILVIIFGLLVLGAGFVTKDCNKRLFSLSMLMVLVPNPNYTYALVMLIPILVIMIDETLSKGDNWCVICMILLIPLLIRYYMAGYLASLICLMCLLLYAHRSGKSVITPIIMVSVILISEIIVVFFVPNIENFYSSMKYALFLTMSLLFALHNSFACRRIGFLK